MDKLKYKILIVEDEAEIRDSLKDILVIQGFDVVTAKKPSLPMGKEGFCFTIRPDNGTTRFGES